MMWQKILLQQKKKQTNQGFITLEILVSIIIALAFVAFSMQALVLAMMLKVEAQEDQRADQLIQEDVEWLNDLASANTLNPRIASILTNTDEDSICLATSYTSGYAQALWNLFTNTDYDNDSIYSSPIIDIDQNGNPDTGFDTMDNGDPINTNSDYEVNPTKQLLRTINNDGSIDSKGVTLTLARTHISGTPGYRDEPYRTLKVYYEVTNNDNEVVAKRYMEVIPDVALECP